MIVYQHIRLDKNHPFYIGIGSNKKRAFRKDGRNNIWRKITQKTNYRVEILFENLTKEEACKKEIELIAKYGKLNDKTGILSNITMGGEILLGKENPMYNHGRKIEIDDIIYDSINAAARKLKLHPKTITYRLKQDSFPNYRKLYGDKFDPKHTLEEINKISYNRNRGINNGMHGKHRSIEYKLLNNLKKKNRYEVIVNDVQYINIKHAEYLTKIQYKKIFRAVNKQCEYKDFTAIKADTKKYSKDLIQKYIDTTNINDLMLYPNPNVIFNSELK